MEPIRVEPLTQLGANKAGTTYTFQAPARTDFVFAERNAGSVSGNHWHSGVEEEKNPEVLLLVKGLVHIIGETETGDVHEFQVEAPAKVIIAPRVTHTLRAITAIAFLEFNSIDAHRKDTHYSE